MSKPKGKGGYCWAWKKGHKARGLAAERAGDREKAETHRCHRRPEGDAERCYLHGGTAKTGKDHHSYKHGFYSRRHHGILARAGEAHEALEVMASSHDELAIHKALNRPQAGRGPGCPKGGGQFQRIWFKVVEELPKDFVELVRFWDTAATEGRGRLDRRRQDGPPTGG